MPKAAILGSGFYVPENVVTNDDLSKLMNTNDKWIQERTGIKERRFVSVGQSGVDMSEIATKAACEKAGVKLEDVEFLILATLSPDYTFPGDSAFLQARLGLVGIPILDLRNQCTGFIYAMSIADKFIKAGDYKTILLVGEEIHSTGLDFSDEGRDLAVMFGDGAGAFIVGAVPDDDPRGIIKTDLHGDGRGAKDLWTECGDSAIYHPRLTHEMLDDGRTYPKMNGRKVFMEAVRRLPETILAVLEGTGYTLDDVDAFVFHQANMRINQFVAANMNLPEEKIMHNIVKYGNTTAATIPILYTEMVQEGMIKEGSLVLFSAFGAGFTWGSVLARV